MWQSYSPSGDGNPMSAADRVAMQARFGVPDNEVPASVPFAAVLARTAEAAVSVVNLQVHSAGLAFTVAARMRQPPDRRERHGGRGVFDGAGVEPGGVLPDDFLRIAVVFADGRVATNLAGHRYLRSGDPIPPDQTVLAQGQGSSGGRRADATYWLTPLPPPGRLVFVCEGPGRGISESRAELDAASQGMALWPLEPIEPAQTPPAAPIVPGTGLFATAAADLARRLPPPTPRRGVVTGPAASTRVSTSARRCGAAHHDGSDADG